jgi:two-component system sensor histidine kinase KdpD
LATLAIYPLKSLAVTASLAVVYLPAVLVIAAYWGVRLGLLTSIASAAAFNFFHLPPIGRFTIADSRNWVSLVAFMLVALVVSTMAELARGRAVEAERRRQEADLAATLASGRGPRPEFGNARARCGAGQRSPSGDPARQRGDARGRDDDARRATGTVGNTARAA